MPIRLSGSDSSAELSTDFGSKEDDNDVVVCSVSELLDGALNEQEWREACETDHDLKSVVRACRYKEGDVLDCASDALFRATMRKIRMIELGMVCVGLNVLGQLVLAAGVGGRAGS
ncbi:hypothetical protein NDU88_003109 [Pleurodeles waltl]|uniref:Uncharacterized protein n=1 Tax=Pleurodeles waltl TaxID=8319 RepID=A0AAV7LHL0_PLEWA|nr:hypothetical protein NDU88_003109 [Pleurodeles waltl]